MVDTTTTAVAEQDATTANNQPQTGTPVEGTDDSTLLGGNTEQKTEGTTEKTDAKVANPEKYELKMPEGMTLDQKALDIYTPIFKELGLSNEQVQKLADTYAPMMQAQSEAVRQEGINSYKATVEGWKAEAKKELGAEAPQKLAKAAEAIQKFASPELKELLNETGLGNNIHFVRHFIKLGESISQDSFVDSKQNKVTADPARVLYPSMNQ